MSCNHKDNKWWEERKFFHIVLMIFAFFGVLFGVGWVLMLLWNWLMPDLFALKSISYWQAWGLLILSCILFQGIRPGGRDGGHHHRKDKRRCKEMYQHIHDIHHGAGHSDGVLDSGDEPIQDK